jgi:ubiquinone/menaquinone biosynthesis C-methylase UbiE
MNIFGVINSSMQNILVQWIVQRNFENMGKQYLKGRLIDIGCGEKPYVNMMKPYVAEHVGVDHQDTFHDKSNIDRVGTAYDIPAKDGEFDSALCTAVMEHLEEPDIAIAECYRVLRTGG